jgi:hypothetical protein
MRRRFSSVSLKFLLWWLKGFGIPETCLDKLSEFSASLAASDVPTGVVSFPTSDSDDSQESVASESTYLCL